jgi:cyclic pyranopterin phosphate synthase
MRKKPSSTPSRAARTRRPPPERPKLSHVDGRGRARMVDVGAKPDTDRRAVARGRVFLHAETLRVAAENRASKGDVFTVARLAAIQAAKRADEWIPLAHTVLLHGIAVEFELNSEGPSIGIQVEVTARGPTGVEMEALTGVAAAALAIYDMLKAIDREMVIGEIALWQKSGGRSGEFRRPDGAPVVR